MKVAVSRIEFQNYQCQLFNLYFIEMGTAANDGFEPKLTDAAARWNGSNAPHPSRSRLRLHASADTCGDSIDRF